MAVIVSIATLLVSHLFHVLLFFVDLLSFAPLCVSGLSLLHGLPDLLNPPFSSSITPCASFSLFSLGLFGRPRARSGSLAPLFDTPSRKVSIFPFPRGSARVVPALRLS